MLGRPWCLRHMTKNQILWNEVTKGEEKKKREFRTTTGVTPHIMYQSLLHGLTEHDNAFAVIFPDHPPHVIHCLRQRSLSRYVGSSQLVALQVRKMKATLGELDTGSKAIVIQLLYVKYYSM